jgi:NAD(P)-dependent dehydrogenase (short-subunit alcohol dehydrogenase family)
VIDDGRVAVITGATGVLGRVVTETFARDGVRVVVVGRDKARLDQLAQEFQLSTGSWLPVVADLRRPEAASNVVSATLEEFGRLDVLIHLVGGWSGGTPIVELDPGELTGMLDQHVWTTLNITKAAVPVMIEAGWGRLIAISSPVASDPGARGASYAIAKAGEELILRTLARELRGTGVTANVVLVRAIDEKHERDRDPTPKNAAWTTPEEIASAMLLLSSPGSESMTGGRIPLFTAG